MDEGLEGGCQCGAVRYKVTGDPVYVALCHCADCRKSAGAPMVSWSAFAEEDVTLTAGEPRAFRSSENSTRSFCPICGTGLFFRNPATLPGLVDIQAATLDDPEAMPPQIHVQTAERLGWMNTIDALPKFERYPGP
ncbi:MAG: GFA family protein [Sphingomonadales bacterium]|nr:GFA family protein [Sphingomonadales bacterium]